MLNYRLTWLLFASIGSLYPLNIPHVNISHEYKQRIDEFMEEKYAEGRYNEDRMLFSYKKRAKQEGITFSLFEESELKNLVRERIFFPLELYFEKEGLFEQGVASIIARDLVHEAFQSVESLNEALKQLDELDVNYIMAKEAYREEVARKGLKIAKRIDDIFQKHRNSSSWAIPMIGTPIAALGFAGAKVWDKLKKLWLKTIKRKSANSGDSSGSGSNSDNDNKPRIPASQGMPFVSDSLGEAVVRVNPAPVTTRLVREPFGVVATGKQNIDLPSFYTLKIGKKEEKYDENKTEELSKVLEQVYYNSGSVKEVKRLLQEGANPNGRSARERGGLQAGAIFDFNTLINDLSCKLLEGMEPEKSIRDSAAEILELLLDYGARIQYPLQQDLERVLGGPNLLLLERGIRISDRSMNDDESMFIQEKIAPYPLISAVIHEDSNKLKSLLNQNQNSLATLLFKVHINKQDNYGRTALHWAMALGDSKAMMLLLRAGADDTIKSKHGLTPVEMALRNGDMMMQWIADYEKQLDFFEKKIKQEPRYAYLELYAIPVRGALELYRGVTKKYQSMLDTYDIYKNRRYIAGIYNVLKNFTSYTQPTKIGPEAEDQIAKAMLSPTMYRAFLRYQSIVQDERAKKVK
jgi:hypothetical protein